MLRWFMIVAASLLALAISSVFGSALFVSLSHAISVSTGWLHLFLFLAFCYAFSRVK